MNLLIDFDFSVINCNKLIKKTFKETSQNF